MSELIFREKQLEVRGLLGREYQPCARLLNPEQRPKADWLHMELLPALILLPSSFGDVSNPNDVLLAAAMELSFLAGRIHDLAAAKKTGSRSILCGDYLYAKAGAILSRGGYEEWLGRIGRVLCRRSEGKLLELGWEGRAYVPPEERLRALSKQNAEGFALAAEISAAGLARAEIEKWSEFGYHIGILQAMQIQGYIGDAYSQEYFKAMNQARNTLGSLPEAMGRAAADFILPRLELKPQPAVKTVGIHI